MKGNDHQTKLALREASETCHETFEQSSEAARFISMLRECSTSTIHELKALLATALSVQKLAVVAEGNVQVQVQDSEDTSTTGSPMQIDNLGQDSDSERMLISPSPSEDSYKSRMSISDGTDTSVDAMTGGPVL